MLGTIWGERIAERSSVGGKVQRAYNSPPLRLPERSRESVVIWGRHQCMGKGLNEFMWL